MSCWWCGAEPVEVFEVTSISGLIRPVPRWRAGGDHDHAESAPTPDELRQAGYAALMRIWRAGGDG